MGIGMGMGIGKVSSGAARGACDLSSRGPTGTAPSGTARRLDPHRRGAVLGLGWLLGRLKAPSHALAYLKGGRLTEVERM